MVYPKGKPKYKILLGKGHNPFQEATQEERIANITVLSILLKNNKALATVKENVDAFLTEITEADTAQKAAINEVELAIQELEKARIEMAVEQYGNLGLMMHHFRKTPGKASAYFDLKAIRRLIQFFFQNKVNKLATKFIVERTVDDEKQATFVNNGNAILRFYLSNKKMGEIGANYLELLPGEVQTIFISSLGDIKLLHFLNVKNMDANNKGEFELEFL